MSTRPNDIGQVMERISNLDVVRAVSIALVVVFHTVNMTSGIPTGLVHLLRGGQLGVDVFFVLSGYLVGRLWWLEEQERDRVLRFRFFMRRALRTVPPYLVMLIVHWGATWAERSQPFEVAYVGMVQNYMQASPFFVVSWSLCIEEHFYLALPLFLGVVRGRRGALALAALALLPMLFRGQLLFSDSSFLDGAYGFHRTATHQRFEGLALGVFGAWVLVHRPGWMASLKPWALACVPLLAGCVLALAWIPDALFYVVGYSAFAAATAVLVGYLSEAPPLPLASSALVRWVSRTTYSTYLTHALIVHVVLFVARSLGLASPLLVWVMTMVGIALSAYVYYRLVEHPSILMRDRLFPSRPRVPTRPFRD